MLEILNLKDSHWKYGLNKQKKFFKENINKEDLHNLLYFKDKLIGYTCLRVVNYNKNLKKIKCFLFDTLIINNEVRSNGYGRLLMNFNNKIIRNYKLKCFLICNKEKKKFYIKFKWKDIHRINDKKYIMIYPKKKIYKTYNLNSLKKIFNF